MTLAGNDMVRMPLFDLGALNRSPVAFVSSRLRSTRSDPFSRSISAHCSPMIYMCAVVDRLRPDLAAKIERGEMSVNEAHRIATGKAKPTSWDRLTKAWNNASEDDRDRLTFQILRAARCPRAGAS